MNITEILSHTPANDSFNDEALDGLSKEDGFQEIPPDASVSGGTELWCEDGNHPFIHSGRGRKPKNCPEHRRVTQTSSGSRTTGASLNRKLRELEQDLTNMFMKGALGAAGTGAPVTGLVLEARAAITAEAMVKIAKGHPKLLKALETGSKAVPALDIGQTLGMSAIAFQLDKQMIPPDHVIAQISGVAQYWVQIHGPIPIRQYVPDVVQEPSRFVPVE